MSNEIDSLSASIHKTDRQASQQKANRIDMTYIGHDSLVRLLLGLHHNSLALFGCQLIQIHYAG